MRQARNHEHRSGQPRYSIGLDQDADLGQNQNLNGWQRPLLGQHLHRTALAFPQTRGRLNRPQFAGGSKVSMDGAYGKK